MGLLVFTPIPVEVTVSTVEAPELLPTADWGGGKFPYRVGHRKLGMWFFIVSDSMTFSALLIGYATCAHRALMAHDVSFLSEHSLLVGDDALPAFFEFYDGLWRLSLGSRRQSSRAQVDHSDHSFRTRFRRPAYDRVEAPFG